MKIFGNRYKITNRRDLTGLIGSNEVVLKFYYYFAIKRIHHGRDAPVGAHLERADTWVRPGKKIPLVWNLRPLRTSPQLSF